MGKPGSKRGKSSSSQTPPSSGPPRPEGWKLHLFVWHFWRLPNGTAHPGGTICGKHTVEILGGGPIRKPWPADLTAAQRRQHRVCKACDEGVAAYRAGASARQDGPPAPADGPPELPVDLGVTLTLKQALFVRHYLANKQNGKQAAIAAGYAEGSATVTASKLLTQANVRAALARLLEPRVEQLDLKAEDVLRELMSIAFSNLAEVIDKDTQALKPIHDWPIGMQRAIGTLEIAREKVTHKDGAEGDVSVIVQDQILKVKSWDKPRALELLAKHLKLLTDRLEVDDHRDLAKVEEAHRRSMQGLSLEELRRLAGPAAAFKAEYEALVGASVRGEVSKP